jgi:hypothetical protein
VIRHVLRLALVGGSVIPPSPTSPPSASRHVSSEGYSFALRIEATTTDDRGRRASDPLITGRARIAGSDGRIDITQGDRLDFRAGNYVITPDAGLTVFVVDPARRSYTRESSETKARDELHEKKIDATISNLVIRADTLNDCAAVDGHPTRCVEITKRYDLTVRYFVFTHRGAITESIRYSVATDLPGLTNAVASYIVGQSFIVIDDENPALIQRARRIDAEWRSAPVVRMHYTVTERSGRKITSQESTVEVSDVTRASIDPSIFELPGGFRRRR